MTRTIGWITGTFIPGPEYLTVTGCLRRPVTLHSTKTQALAGPNHPDNEVVALVERLNDRIFQVVGGWDVRALPTTCQYCTAAIRYARAMNVPVHGETRPGWETVDTAVWTCDSNPNGHPSYGHFPHAWDRAQVTQ